MAHPSPLRAALEQALVPWADARQWCVAYSGGPDSSALLHALVRMAGDRPGVRLRALHVDHRLQPLAAEWGEHCRRVCEALGLPLEVRVLDRAPAAGDSIEAWARRERYREFRESLAPGELLFAAHHRDDQAETLLLQLLRGSGPKGLAAMAAAAPLGEGWLLRPLLSLRREDLAAYVRDQDLHVVQDPSNEDLRRPRNFLRRRLLPLVKSRWPACVATLARAAELQSELLSAMDELAQADLAAVSADGGRTLAVAALEGLSPERRHLVLRAWVAQAGLPHPARRHVGQMERDLLGPSPGRSGRVGWPGAEVRRYRDSLYVMAPLPAPVTGRVYRWEPGQTLDLPQGRLRLRPAEGLGIRCDMLESACLTVRFRRGGERCRPAGHPHSRPLKKLLQDAGIPPWERPWIPLVYLEEDLAAVVGHWICEPFAAGPGEAGWMPEWEFKGDAGP